MAYSTGDILAQLDHAAEDMLFPMLDNGYVYPVDVRLHAYRDPTRWALVIEHLGFSPRARQLDNAVYSYGNCLPQPPGISNRDFLAAIDETLDDLQDPGHPEHARPGLASLHAHGVTITLPRHDRPWPLVELFRSLVPRHRDLLLASDQELRARIPPDLPELLRLDAWQHPDIAAEQAPSQTTTFQQLARALVTGDPHHYQPTSPPNTHWSNWPDGGTL